MPTQTINLNDFSPLTPTGQMPVRWQSDPPSLDTTVVRDVSAYVAPTPGVLHAGVGAPPNVGIAYPAALVQNTVATDSMATFGSAVTAGNLLIVACLGYSVNSFGPPTDSIGTPYALLGRTPYPTGGAEAEALVFGGIAPSSGANTVTWPYFAALQRATSLLEFSGVTAAVDGVASSILASSGTLITTQVGDILLAIDFLNGYNGWPAVFTPGVGFSLVNVVTPTSANSGTVYPSAAEWMQTTYVGAVTVAMSFTGNTGAGQAFVALALKSSSASTGIGADGDFYLDTATGKLYGPRFEGSWSLTTGGGIVQADGTSITRSGAGILTAVIPMSVGFTVPSGETGTNVGPELLAMRAATLSKCRIVVKTSDSSTALQVRIKQNGVDIFSADPTVAAGAAADSVSTFTSLTSLPLPVADGDRFTLDVVTGGANWAFTVQLG